MLGIESIVQLADWTGVSPSELKLAAEFADDHIEELFAWDPLKRDEPRPVISVTGRLRKVQSRLLKRVFQKRLFPSEASFGGVRGRHILASVRMHSQSKYVYKTDISKFFPSITNRRINDLFIRQFQCSPTVSRLLTRLCTYKYHLALGLLTSPILADQMLRKVDNRLQCLCDQRNLVYTRFVDDITVSGQYDLADAQIPQIARGVLKSHGFRVKNRKDKDGPLSDDILITKLSLVKGYPDVSTDYIRELERQLSDHASLSGGGPFDGPYLTSSQLYGKVHYACWINPRRKHSLMRRLKSIRWDDVVKHATMRNYVAAQKVTTRRNEPPPDWSACYGDGRTRTTLSQPQIEHLSPHEEIPFDAD